MALEPVSLDNEIRSLQPGLSASEGVSTTKARYWDQKARDHTFHPDRHGGRRYSTLEWPDELALQWAVFYMWRTEPALTDEQVVDFLRQQGWTSRFWHLSGGDFEGICAWNLLRVCSS
eukprot:g16157.t1